MVNHYIYKQCIYIYRYFILESSDIQVMKVGSSEDNDSLEVIIPVFVSAAFITMVLGTIAGKLFIV